jgi:hypothetical protein
MNRNFFAVSTRLLGLKTTERTIAVWNGFASMHRWVFWALHTTGQSAETSAANGRLTASMGENISLMEMPKVVPALVMDFDVEIEGTWTTRNRWFVGQEFRSKVLERRNRAIKGASSSVSAAGA